MPRPKLIQFGEPEPPQQEKAPAQDVFNEKPKKAQKFKPPQKDLSVAPLSSQNLNQSLYIMKNQSRLNPST